MCPLKAIALAGILSAGSARALNLSIGATATSGGAGFGTTDAMGIDGNRNGFYGGAGGSLWHSAGASAGADYYEANLGSVKQLDSLFFFHRQDVCCTGRAVGLKLRVFDGSHSEIFATTVTSTNWGSKHYESFALPFGTAGQYVRVEHTANEFVQVAELEIYGHNTLPNIARNPLAVASQSTTDFDGSASRGNDGFVDGDYFNGIYYTGGTYNSSVTHTQDVANSFWEVSLGSDYLISAVEIFNRTDFIHNRLSNFRLSVFDGATETYGVDINSQTAYDTDYSIPTTLGDRVRIQLNGLNQDGNGFLHLGEVAVRGVAVPEPSAALMALLACAGTALRRKRA